MTEQFTPRQIYLKDLSFQVPSGASIFTDAWKPQVKIDVKVSHAQVQGGLTEVVLTISVVGTNNGSTAFMIEVLQAGIFQVTGFSGEALRQKIDGAPDLGREMMLVGIDGVDVSPQLRF